MMDTVRLHEERGATAILVAASLFLIIGMTAIAIDAGMGWTERRADQTAVDLGAVGGAVELLVGTSAGNVSEEAMVQAALDYVRINLPTAYSDGEWQAIWQNCVDPAAERNAPDDRQPGGYNFVSMADAAPAGWSIADPDNWCISKDGRLALFRVRTPPQIVETTFARVLGFDQLQTRAAAVVEILSGGGNVLPFGLPVSAADGSHHCIGSAPPGLAVDPCPGQSQGNRGLLGLKRYTYPSGCANNVGVDVIAVNIAEGADHPIVPMTNPGHDGHNNANNLPSGEIADSCYELFANVVRTENGQNQVKQATLAGLVGDGLPSGYIALLKKGPQPKTSVVGYSNLDNRPLWHWLLADVNNGGSVDYGTDAPLMCDPAGFVDGPYDVDGNGSEEDQFDFDNDGSFEDLDSWQHMQRCLTEYANGPYSTVIFSEALGDQDGSNWSPRLGYVPQMWESNIGLDFVHVKRYRAIFVQGLYWKRGNNWTIFYPGEGCFDDEGQPKNCNGSNFQFQQATAIIIPDAALPAGLRGDPPGENVGYINPFITRIYR
jgi:hypothetical protein